MSEGSGEIIIKGGSVDLNYDDTLYPKDPNDPKRHRNGNRKITRIKITDNGGEVYDSGDHEAGLRWTVTVYTK